MLLSQNITSYFWWPWTSQNSFRRNPVTYGTPCHAIGHFVFCYNHVTYRTPCHASGHLVIYCECYGFERAFFTLRRFLLCTPSSCFQGFPGSRQFNLKVSKISCWFSKHSLGPTTCLNRNNPQKRYGGRFYLRVMAGQLLNKESAPCGIRTLSMIVEHVKSVWFFRSAKEPYNPW